MTNFYGKRYRFSVLELFKWFHSVLDRAVAIHQCFNSQLRA